MNDNKSVLPFLTDQGPVFDEPWHAQILAIADGLVNSGAFSAIDWANALGAERQAAVVKGAKDSATEE